MHEIKAVILAAGKGTRMRELTQDRPKPMLLVQGKPILEHIIEGLKEHGVREFFIVTGFRADVIEAYFGDGSRWGVRVSYGRQEVQDGTGKAPELAKEFVGESPFILTYGDILVRPDTYRRLIHRFQEKDGDALVTVTAGEDVTKGGIFLFQGDWELVHLVEKPSLLQVEELKKKGLLKTGDPAWYNAGIYLFKPVVYEYTARLEKSPRGEFELTDALSAMIVAGLKMGGLQIEGRWVDVRDPEVLAQLENE